MRHGKPAEPITSCIRCGSCCSTSSPDIFENDHHLVERGKLPLKSLFTLRETEPKKIPTTGQIIFQEADIVKIKHDENLPHCIFFDIDSGECTAYLNRPSICRAFKCWDTRQVEDLKTQAPLTRKDIIGSVKEIWALVEEHQKKCDYRDLKRHADNIDNSEAGPAAIAAIDEMIAYDKSIRVALSEKGNMDPEMMDFLFGRPITINLSTFNLGIIEQPDGKKVLKKI